jgi:hypothetical protein
MKLAIMQPYFFPYIGYWQLISSVDKFIIYDDVNFIKGGYVNRNYILEKNERKIISLELIGASSFKKINEIVVGRNRKKLVKVLKQNYSKAPFFKQNIEFLETAIMKDESNLADYLGLIIKDVCSYLNINTEIVFSSQLSKDNNLTGQNKVIDICKNVGCDTYINSPGGKDLYSIRDFKDNNIDLKFINSEKTTYKQFDSTAVDNLSIIDILMFNDIEKISEYLDNYKLNS